MKRYEVVAEDCSRAGDVDQALVVATYADEAEATAHASRATRASKEAEGDDWFMWGEIYWVRVLEDDPPQGAMVRPEKAGSSAPESPIAPTESSATTRASDTKPLSQTLQLGGNCVDVTAEKLGTRTAIVGAEAYRKLRRTLSTFLVLADHSRTPTPNASPAKWRVQACARPGGAGRHHDDDAAARSAATPTHPMGF
jgi:hypothetical protein